jgi:hypothetical protein
MSDMVNLPMQPPGNILIFFLGGGGAWVGLGGFGNINLPVITQNLFILFLKIIYKIFKIETKGSIFFIFHSFISYLAVFYILSILYSK